MNSEHQAERDCWITNALSEYESSLVRYVLSLVGDINIAREIVQEAFLRLCSQPQDEVASHLKSWLFRVSRNAAIDYLRKEKRMQSTETAAIDQWASTMDEDSVDRREQAQSLAKQVSQLPANQQEVLRLRFENQLSYQQIAEVTGHTKTNVGFMLHTAIKRLRKSLLPEISNQGLQGSS